MAAIPFIPEAISLSNLALVIPQKELGYQPQDKRGNAEGKALLFHYELDNQLSLESDITDHYVEDNTAVIDHIALRPESVRVTGIIGELNNVVPDDLRIAEFAAGKMLLLAAFTPELSVTAITAYNQAKQLYDTFEAIKKGHTDKWSTLKKDTQTLQQTLFKSFYGHWSKRTLFTIQTPWALFKDMAIQSLKATQSGESKSSSDFDITFKKIRTVKTIIEERQIEQEGAGRTKNQGDKKVNNIGEKPTPDLAISEVMPLKEFI